jgi:O-antigen chain-terminating bifunctional methyltransferase/kinase
MVKYFLGSPILKGTAVNECLRMDDNAFGAQSTCNRARQTIPAVVSSLVAKLPEVYQPILGHPELCHTVSRRCEDRLAHILLVYQAMEKTFSRPLRVLDLGCAQGFFSLKLSQLGAQVHGVDCLEANISVCEALAAEQNARDVLFETAQIEDVLSRLETDRYDLILGLSVFHHIVEARGVPYVRGMLAAAGVKVAAAVFEIALAEEPLAWAAAQPQSARELISDYAFVHEIGRHATHLSEIRRPLFFASNRHWYLDGETDKLDRWEMASNAVAPDAHRMTRRFYFSGSRFITQFLLDDREKCAQNLLEWESGVAFLKNPPPGLTTPRLERWGRHEAEAWLVRELLPGATLETHIAKGYRSYDPDRVLRDILQQLLALEAVDLFHQDLRAWNVVIDTNGHATLIDYGAISKSRVDCAWPHNVFLSFLIFMREVLLGVQEFPAPHRAGCLNPDRLPEPYKKAVWRMLHVPFDQWRFADFHRNLQTAQSGSEPTAIDCSNASLLLGACESGITDLHSQITKLKAYADSYDKQIAALEIPNAPLSLKIVLPLARIVRSVRATLLNP